MSETSLLVSLPLVAAMLAAAVPQAAASTGQIATIGNAALAVMLAVRVGASGATSEALGGWAPPLGIVFAVDGLAALMLVMTALVGLGVAVQVAGWVPRDPAGLRQRAAFWPLWLATLGAMNALFLSADLFNLYVTFEILGLVAVGLTALSGTRPALRAAFDYLSAGLAGSLLLLLGVALAYATAGRVDLAVVPQLAAGWEGRMALGLIFAGLAVKAALFPLHFWMPAAHSSALPAASAILSALVIKAAIYVALRLSIDGGAAAEALRVSLAVAGAGAMLWGAWHALRADRLKLLVAHSTVAQVGLISLAIGVSGTAADGALWQAAALLMLSHALAKAAMFLAVGRIAEELGHDRISGLNREELRPGAAEFAFAIAAISLIGLPPTAGFVGKWVLMEGLIDRGAWVWAGLVLAGTALSAAYLARVVSRCLRGGPHVAPGARRPAWRAGDVAALGLATAALALGLASALPLTLLESTLT